MAWTSAISPHKPLIGMSHGAAGIALALSRLSEATGDTRFVNASRDALLFERLTLKNPLRYDSDHSAPRTKLPASWCHGWAGIGLSRVGMLGLDCDRTLVGEIERCCAEIRQGRIGRNASICHGDMGKLELFLVAGRRINSRCWTGHENAALAALLEAIETGHASLGHPKGTRSVGLMNGLAGAGYGLLRAAFPDQVPSILMLDPVVPPDRPRSGDPVLIRSSLCCDQPFHPAPN